MKIEVNLDNLTIGEWGESVAQVIKDELTAVVRVEVRALMKARREHIRKAVQQAVSETLDGLNKQQIANLAKKLLEQG
jgi:hypothetical protein